MFYVILYQILLYDWIYKNEAITAYLKDLIQNFPGMIEETNKTFYSE
jgi:hypothetical protein